MSWPTHHRRDRTASRKPAAHSPVWAALLMAGIVTAVLRSQRQALKRLASAVFGKSRGRGGARRAGAATAPVDSPHLTKLRDAILGADKVMVASVLGPPPTTAGEGTFTDDTWYYPLDLVARVALAIRFEHNIARHTDVLRAPR